jgi:hypothetical protein
MSAKVVKQFLKEQFLLSIYKLIHPARCNDLQKFWGRKFRSPTHLNPLVQNSGYPK